MDRSSVVGLGLCLLCACGTARQAPADEEAHRRLLRSCDAGSDCSAPCDGGLWPALDARSPVARDPAVGRPAVQLDFDAAAEHVAVDTDVDAGSDDYQPRDSTRLDCDGIRHRVLPPGLERLDSLANESLLAADAQTVYGTDRDDLSQWIWGRSEPSGPTRRLAPDSGWVRVLVVDGDELLFSFSRIVREVFVSKVPIGGGTAVNIARESFAHATSIVADDEIVYWLADDDYGAAGVTTLLRSDREPGTTTTLASIGGQAVPGSLQRVGHTLYFAMYDPHASQMQMYIFEPGANRGAQPFGSPAGIASLASDGTQLFVGLVAARDRLDNEVAGEHGIARIDLSGGTFELLFAESELSSTALSVDATDVYWVAGAEDRNTQVVRRGDKRGTGQPTEVAHGWAGSTALTQDASSVYWTVACGGIDYLVRAAK